jgi:hypothetical protein
MRLVILTALLASGALGLTACDPSDSTTQDPGKQTTAPEKAASAKAAPLKAAPTKAASTKAAATARRSIQAERPPTRTALAAVAGLTVKGRAPKTGYARDQFGQPWFDTDRNGSDP